MHVALRRADDVHRRAGPPRLRVATTCRSLRTGIMAGSPCPVEVMKRVRRPRCTWSEVTICYGMTETSPVSTQTGADDDLERRVVDRRPGAPARRGQDRRPGDRADRAARRAGRALHPRLLGDARLLGRRRRRPPRRSTPPAGCTPATSAMMDDDGYVQHHRPHQGHGHPRRREHLPARDRGVPLRPPRHRRRAGRSACPTPKYGEELMAWVQLRAGARRSTPRTRARVLPGQARPLQDPALRARRRRVPDDGDRQGPQGRDARASPWSSSV